MLPSKDQLTICFAHVAVSFGLATAIRAALVKSVTGDNRRSAAERELAIQQIVSRAVVSTEIVDIMTGKHGHLNPVGRVPRRGAREQEEEPRHRL